MKTPVEIKTARLILRELKQADLPSLKEILQDPIVMKAYEHAFSDQEVMAWFNNQQQRYLENGFGLWAVVLQETGEMIGQCGLTYQMVHDQKVLEIGYLLKKNFWKQGFATEAAKACKEYAFESLKRDEVFAIIRDTNLASQSVAKRLGMTLKTTVNKFYYQMEMPHYVYSLKRRGDNSRFVSS